MNADFYDAIIIGFGKAGKTLAVALANAGQRVAMVERSSKMYGGTCINIACIPTKALVSAAAHNESFDQAMTHKEAVVSLLHNRNYHMLADNPHVTVIDGEGSFVDSHTVSVRAGDERLLINAPRIFINTGAEPIIPPITGIEDSQHVYTSTELLDHTHQPQRLAVIGGGYVGLEFASTYAKLGSKVTVFQRSDALFTDDDPQAAAASSGGLLHSTDRRGILMGLLTAGAAVVVGSVIGNRGQGGTTQDVEATGNTVNATISVEGLRFAAGTVAWASMFAAATAMPSGRPVNAAASAANEPTRSPGCSRKGLCPRPV